MAVNNATQKPLVPYCIIASVDGGLRSTSDFYSEALLPDVACKKVGLPAQLAGIDVGLFLIIFVFLGPLTVSLFDLARSWFSQSRLAAEHVQVMNMVVAVLVHVVSSVATLQHKNQQNGRDLRKECIAKGGV